MRINKMQLKEETVMQSQQLYLYLSIIIETLRVAFGKAFHNGFVLLEVLFW